MSRCVTTLMLAWIDSGALALLLLATTSSPLNADEVLNIVEAPASAVHPMNAQVAETTPATERPLPPAPNSPVTMDDPAPVPAPAAPEKNEPPAASSPVPTATPAEKPLATEEAKPADKPQTVEQPKPSDKPKMADKPKPSPKNETKSKPDSKGKPKPENKPKPVDKPALSPTGVDLKKGATKVEDAGPDYALQGEYMTWDWSPAMGWQLLGIQVVARGDGKFDALAYPGGLPGNGVGPRTTMPNNTPILEPTSELLPPTWQGTGKAGLDGLVIDFPKHPEGRRFITRDGQAGQLLRSDGSIIAHAAKWHRRSQREGALPPAGAISLFDGTDSGQLKNLKLTPDGLMEIGSETKGQWQNFHLHAEFKTPFMPFATSQARANSGFYLQKRYEVQVLDSFGLIPQFNDAAAIYRFKMPDLNMSFPPLVWQTYDIQFQAPLFDKDGKKIQNGRLTVWHNGVVVQDHVSLENKTGGGSQEGPQALPILFQNHGNPVHFRNIWLLELAPQTLESPASSTPVAVATCTPQTQTTCQPDSVPLNCQPVRHHVRHARRRCR